MKTKISNRERITKPDSGFYWLTFVDHETGEFKGAAIVWGSNFDDALSTSWKLGVNPGGEAHGWKYREGRQPKEEFLNRLLSEKEIVDNWDTLETGRELKLWTKN
jgi:hypothetical protein